MSKYSRSVRAKLSVSTAIVLCAAPVGAIVFIPDVGRAIDASPPKPKRECVWDLKGARWRCPSSYEIPGTKRECVWDLKGLWDITSDKKVFSPVTLRLEGMSAPFRYEGVQWIRRFQGSAIKQNGETGRVIGWLGVDQTFADNSIRYYPSRADEFEISIDWDPPGPNPGELDQFDTDPRRYPFWGGTAYDGTVAQDGSIVGSDSWQWGYPGKWTGTWSARGKAQCIPKASLQDVITRPGDNYAPPPGPPPITQPPPVTPGAPRSGGTEPYGSIGDKHAKLGGTSGALGSPIAGESDAPHGGRCQAFQHGMICWHPQIGEAFGVWGSIHDKWAELGRAEFGYPITDERATADGRGRYNHFRGMQYPNRPESSIFWSPQTGAHAIYGAIRDEWAKQGWERGTLGYPTSDEHQDGKYRRVNFERGVIRWAPDTGIELSK